MLSLNFEKNPAPSSIQVILRTDEISDEQVKDNSVNIGLRQRNENVFVRIRDWIKGIVF